MNGTIEELCLKIEKEIEEINKSIAKSNNRKRIFKNNNA